MGAEPPTRIRGGAILGGIGAARPDEIGKVTEYVLQQGAVPGAADRAARGRPPPGPRPSEGATGTISR